MTLDAFATVLVMYSIILSGALTVLLWAFKGSLNPSGRLFLLSQAMNIPSVIAIGVAHVFPDMKTGALYFIGNASFLIAELTFVFSLYALPRGKESKLYPVAVIGALVIAAATEIVRLYNAFLPLQIYVGLYASLSFAAIWVCANTSEAGLRNAPFWKILRYIETIFLVLSLFRGTIQLTGTPATPMEGGSLNLLLLAALLSLLVFRYIAYQSIWMTWTSPLASENRLNQNLLSSLRERDLLLQQLAASNRRIGVSALASSLAHELSQPLTAAALQAEVVKQKMGKSSEQADALRGIERVSDMLRHLSNVVHNLQSLFGAQDVRQETLAFEPLCNEVVKLVDLSENASGVTFRISGHVQSRILGNAIQIQQVIVNIIDNAIEASASVPASDRTIDITFGEENGFVSLTVRDRGTGFPADVLDNIFDIYRTSKEDGTGIGLWLCKQIVEKHKGVISVSNPPDGGACVRLELPAAGPSQ